MLPLPVSERSYPITLPHFKRLSVCSCCNRFSSASTASRSPRRVRCRCPSFKTKGSVINSSQMHIKAAMSSRRQYQLSSHPFLYTHYHNVNWYPPAHPSCHDPVRRHFLSSLSLLLTSYPGKIQPPTAKSRLQFRPLGPASKLWKTSPLIFIILPDFTRTSIVERHTAWLSGHPTCAGQH